MVLRTKLRHHKDKVTGDEMSRICRMDEGDEKFVQNFSWKKMKVTGHLEDLSAHGRIILK
jgi:hypothetical protein